jgi:hypothetical protein
MSDWYSSVYKSFIMASIVSFLISFFSTGNVAFGSLIAGYSVLILGIMMILIILFQNILKTNQDQKLLYFIYLLLLNTGPFLLILGVICFILYLIIFYKNIIIENHVSKSYYTFSNMNIVLLLIQLYIVYTNISTKSFDSSGKLSKVTMSIITLLGILTLMSSLILFTILKYYTTDGFMV